MNLPDVERLPPHSLEAEQGVLGCLLLDPTLLSDCHDLAPDAFYDNRHRTLFNAMVRMERERRPIDPATLNIFCREQGLVDSAGGASYLAELPDLVPSAANLPYYLQTLTEKWKLRRLLQDCLEVAETVHAAEHDPEVILSDAEIRLTGSFSKTGSTREDLGFQELLDFDTTSDPSCLVGMRSGQTTRYLCRGYGAWLVGPSGVGKSSLLFLFAVSFAAGLPVYGMQPVRPLRVLVIQAENDKGDMAEQARGVYDGLGLAFSEAEDLVKCNLRVRSVRGKIGASWVAWLRGEIQAWNADLVMVDPLLSFAGIDVSRQDQCTQFLRLWLDPVLAETGAALLSVHHTGKPKGENGHSRGPQTLYDRMYAGLGSSELVNWARAVMLIEPAGDNLFRLHLAKRGKRAGATHPNNEPTSTVWLKHADGRIFWEQVEPPQEPDEASRGDGARRPSAKQSIVDPICKHPALATFLMACTKEGEGKNAIARRLEKCMASQPLGERIAASEKTWKNAVDKLVVQGKLNFNGEVYTKGPNA